MYVSTYEREFIYIPLYVCVCGFFDFANNIVNRMTMNNKELEYILHEIDLVTLIKSRPLSWLGHAN